MPSILEKLLRDPRTYVEAPEDGALPPPDPADDHMADPIDAKADGVKPSGTSPDPSDLFQPLKDLAQHNLPLVQHIVNLRKAYLEDPHLGSKEAETSMAAIMHHLWRKDERAAYYFGRITFEPNIDSFIALFDDIGSQPLGPYLGIKSSEEIPKGNGKEDAPGGADELSTALNSPADANPAPGPGGAPEMGGGPPQPQQPGAPEAPNLPTF